MNVKRYFAQTAREALRALKAELGADAIVLSNRAVEGGVEILALPADEVSGISTAARLAPQATPATVAQAPRPASSGAPRPMSLALDDDDFHVSLSGRGQREDRSVAAPATAPKIIKPFTPPRM
jgi:flagellar biosynthesis protein FlhF